MYDYLIVGAGFFSAVCAHELNKKGKKVLVIEKRAHLAGNAYTENNNGIHVHKYGAHIFHTNNKDVWEYVNQFSEFNGFINSPVAFHKNSLYNLPFNMNTFYQLWGVKTPAEAKLKIDSQKSHVSSENAKNLEEKAIALVGSDIYNILIKGYTEKQWGRSAKELPAFIINRLPVRFTFDNNYFSDRYQGIPIGGYTKLIQNMFGTVEIKLSTDYFEDKDYFDSIAEKIIYTGPIDQYFNYCYGELGYRSLRFEHEVLDSDNFQGVAVVNYTEFEIPYTRIIEHKHFDPVDTSHTVITKEYPVDWTLGAEAYYPINDEKNMSVYRKYRELAKAESKVIFGGRLAEYKYYDMHQVIASALNTVSSL
ncbi:MULTISPECIES: UDP-galactopyranose mutase [Klebsiella pneumoniae complex]|uniref:UDP-galactopyranose mutase n=1 Tax=Klebsiella pneumoniae complex TaxID=3390273 RepID=UPI0006581401|nr:MULTISPECIES: UDP-galactopyranose mutase [Klebsiella]EKV8434293.1 UDP-galactopyranose mutase [Klebsiella variicola]KMI12383.1 UDP-galactopyranose mutase [Klebsiella variicola]MCZ9525069.1 UDP-galactopyranose mutase [Klebsiella quasipneumoniae]HDE1021682.1 UDP-galactopyranose mutase [Klebsiella quasipneumoniae]HDG7807123.1 UDP-galactopyranose mutase [Klebsiella quasipneumoniae]